MSTLKLTPDFLLKHYVRDGKSTVEISEMASCFPEQVRRALKKHNIPVRTKSTASKNFYQKGGTNSRKGYEFTEEEKENASIVAKEYWMSDEASDARQRISEASKIMWDKKTDNEKKVIVAKLHAACRLASKEGSKAERKIAELLANKYGYKAHRGVTELAGLGNLEVDIALMDVGIIIEVDGITHFADVYSDNRYERAQIHDKEKNDKMTGAGWSVIRVQLVCERFSVGSCLMVCEKLNTMIQEKTFEARGVSYVEMT